MRSNTSVPSGKQFIASVSLRLCLLVLFASLAAIMRYLDNAAIDLGRLSDSVGVSGFLVWVFGGAAVFEVASLAIYWSVHARRGSSGEIKMLVGFTRVVAVVAVAILLLSYTGKLQQLGAVVGAFAGMLLGWSLQAPVSGFAAWVLITLKRPFRLGDRVLFPSLGLSGDVLEVGLMYTKLDQVGGSIGSEDAIGRHILIPNAMLFGQVAINYTPQAQSAYFLDEVVIRLTYDSDMAVAERILLDAAEEVTADIIKVTGKRPYIRSDLYDYGVYVRLRYMTLAMDRPRMSHEIVSRIFREFQHDPRVDFAIPFVYSGRRGMEVGSRGAEYGGFGTRAARSPESGPDSGVKAGRGDS